MVEDDSKVSYMGHIVFHFCDFEHTVSGFLYALKVVLPEAAIAHPISSWLLRRQTYRTPDEVLFGLAYTTPDGIDGGWEWVDETQYVWWRFQICGNCLFLVRFLHLHIVNRKDLEDLGP